jgi:hypothetical protein
MTKLLALFAVVACAVAVASDAAACSFAPLTVHELDPAEQAVDTTAPAAPVITGYSMVRNPPSDDACAATSCDGSGQIGIELAPGADDRTPAARLGYRIRLLGGVPEGLTPPPEAVRPDASGTIWLLFSDRGQAIAAELAISAVDLAGNVSNPVPYEVRDGGDGCRASGRMAGAWGLVMIAVVGGLRSRRSAQIATRMSRSMRSRRSPRT